jgi:hypothetical protein
MRITPYYNIYTNQVSDAVADEIVARMDALSALNRNVSPYASSKQFFAVRDKTTAKPELLRKFQEWRDTKVAFGEVRAFRRVSSCCKGKLKKSLEPAPFLVSVAYDDENNMVPGMNDKTGTSSRLSYGDIKYSVSNGLNKPSFYNGQPQAFLQTVSVTNEGYAGAVQKVRIRMRVFTREAFEVIDKWLLRPGNEMLVKFGWSVPLSSTDTACEVIHAVIFNFNATLTDDMGWDITVYGIAKGNVAVGLGINASADLETVTQQQEDATQQQYLVPSLTTVLQEQLKEIKTIAPSLEQNDNVNGLTPDDTDGQGGRYGIIYESSIFPHGIGRVKFLVENSEVHPDTVEQQTNTGTPGDPDSIQPASDAEYEKYISDLIAREKSEIDDDWVDTEVDPDETYGTGLDALKGKNDRGARLVRYFKSNFGFLQPTVTAYAFGSVFGGGDGSVFPDPLNANYREQLYTFFTEEDVSWYSLFSSQTLEGRGKGSKFFVNDRPPTPGLRKRIWQEMEPYIKEISLYIINNSLSDEQKKQFQQDAEERKKLAEQFNAKIQQLTGQVETIEDSVNDLGQRITNPQSSARYFICLGDLVYFFNEKVFKQAPELYESVQILVENQITTYDPNVVSSNPMEVIFSNALNYAGGMSRYGEVEYGFLRKRIGFGTPAGAPRSTGGSSQSGVIAYTGASGGVDPHLHVQWGDKRPITIEDVDKYLRVENKLPSSYRVSSNYGKRKPPRKPNGTYGSSFHRGIDIATPTRQAISLVNGAVFLKNRGYRGGAGLVAQIDTADGIIELLHLDEIPIAAPSNNEEFIVSGGDNSFELTDAPGVDGVTYLSGIDEFTSEEDIEEHTEDWGILLDNGTLIAAFNVAHIWISVDTINEIYVGLLKDKAVDPQYKTILMFFEHIFGKIADASGGIMQLSFVPDLNELYTSAKEKDPINVKSTSEENPLLKQTHMLRIVDVNHQLPFNLGPRTLSFKVNDVNTTLLRDLDVTMKLPSKMQTVAYTFGRQGLNDDIVDISEESGICQVDNSKLIETRQKTYDTLQHWKSEVGKSMSRENLENLQNALIEYAKNPVPIATSPNDTSNIQVAHQGWIFSRLYPIELQLKLDGISGFLYGNKIDVLNALPSRYSDTVYFTITKIEHEVADNDWVTTITGIARLKFSHTQLQFPNIIENKEECGGPEAVVETGAYKVLEWNMQESQTQNTNNTGGGTGGGGIIAPGNIQRTDF